MTYYYAQLNEKDVCISVHESGGLMDDDVLIQIPSYDQSYVGKHYNRETQTWETATFKHLSEHSTDEINVGETDQSLTDALNDKISKSGGEFTGVVDFSGGLVRVGGKQTFFNSGTMMNFGTGHLPLNLIGSNAIYATHSIQVTSDIRMKKDFKAIDFQQAVNFIKNLNVCEFKYKDSEDKHIGVIAQQVQLADPEIGDYFVKTNPETGMLSVAEGGLVYPTIIAVQALMNEVARLQGMVIQMQMEKQIKDKGFEQVQAVPCKAE